MTTPIPRGGGGSARPGIRRVAPFEDGENRLELGAQVLDGLGRERAARLRVELARAAILLDLLAGALDGVLLGVEQVLDQHDQLDLAPLVHAVAGAVLGGVQEPELAFPVAQHVRLEIGELTHLADREELLDRLRRAHRPPPSRPHCSAFRSRPLRPVTALPAASPRHNTPPTPRAIGGATPRRPARPPAERPLSTPSPPH